jgi:hypothetical protein
MVLIFRAHLRARCAPRVGLVHERRAFLLRHNWSSCSDSAPHPRRVHMRQNEPSLWSGVLPRPLLYTSEPCPSLSQPQSSSHSVSSPSSTVCPSSSPPSHLCSFAHSPSHHQGSTSPCLRDASASSTTSEGEGVAGTTASSWSRPPFSSS